MSVDLSNLIPFLEAEMSVPGSDNYPAATDETWTTLLINGFWGARMDGMLAAYTCTDDGIVTPINPDGEDMSRELQQLVVMYASFSALRSTLRNMRTQFHVSAGSVTFEYEQSSYLLVEMMKDITTRRDLLLDRLSDLGAVPTYIVDAVRARLDASSDDWWW